MALQPEKYSNLRVEKHQIKSSNPYYKVIDELCIKAKNLYNYSSYCERQFFFQKEQLAIELNRRYLGYFDLVEFVKGSDAYECMSTCFSNQIVKRVATTFKGFMKANNDYYENPDKYLGKPKLPRYKDKETGRCIFSLCGHSVRFEKTEDGLIAFNTHLQGFTVKTHLVKDKHKLKEARFIPKNGYILLEIVYELKDTPPVLSSSEFKHAAGIDVGIDNFATIVAYRSRTNPIIINGKGLKSYNKYFNKMLARLQSDAKKKNNKYTTKRIKNLFRKRMNYIENWMHHASRLTARYLYENKVRIVYIGKGKGWKNKSKLSKKVNQTFVQIPYEKYIQQVVYKCQDLGIRVYIVDESYTSGTSFIDNEHPISEHYNKNRRVYRGLFKANTGRVINSDVNAALQIMKKDDRLNMRFKRYYPLYLNPIRVNVA